MRSKEDSIGPHDPRRQRVLNVIAFLTATPLAMLGGGSGGAESSRLLSSGPGEITDDAPALQLPDIPVVLQAVVEKRGSTVDGPIVELVGPAWRVILDTLAREPGALTQLTPRQLEELIAASYDAAGFEEVVLTPRSGDYGRDVIASRRDGFSIRIIDQVKAYSPGHRVTANDVRALSGVLHGDPRATKGVVSTTSTFAPGIDSDPFLSPFIPFRLELFDGAALTERLLNLRS
jgi:restriction system protein